MPRTIATSATAWREASTVGCVLMLKSPYSRPNPVPFCAWKNEFNLPLSAFQLSFFLANQFSTFFFESKNRNSSCRWEDSRKARSTASHPAIAVVGCIRNKTDLSKEVERKPNNRNADSWVSSIRLLQSIVPRRRYSVSSSLRIANAFSLSTISTIFYSGFRNSVAGSFAGLESISIKTQFAGAEARLILTLAARVKLCLSRDSFF